jgi:hypothetical protein
MSVYRHIVSELVDAWGEDNFPRFKKALDNARDTLMTDNTISPTIEELHAFFDEHHNGLEEIWRDDFPAVAYAILDKWGK